MGGLSLFSILGSAGCAGTTTKPASTSSTTSTSGTAPSTPASSAQLVASTASVSFGNVAVGTSTAQLVSFTNSGSSNLIISSVSASGTGLGASGGSGVTLAPGATVTVSVSFLPTAAGNITGTLSAVSNASNPALQVALSGSGIVQQAATTAESVVLSWTASTSQVGGYNVYRGSVSGGPYTKLNTNVDTSASYTDAGMAVGTYYYVVTALTSVGAESAYSNEANAIVP
jgi:hypothetical protein